jgi:hypothetical protein
VSTVPKPRFDDVVEPHRANLVGVIDAGQELRDQYSLMPGAASEGMKELSLEAQVAGGWGDENVTAAHGHAGILLYAAEDHLRSLARLVVGEPTVYAPLVLLRSALEACGRSMWLSESGIGARGRVARYQTERLFDLYQRKRLGLEPQQDVTTRAKAITDAGEALGFEVKLSRDKKYRVIEADRPTGTAVFASALNDEKVGARLGPTLFGYSSAVAHGTPYGLHQAIDQEQLEPTFLEGTVNAPMVMKADITCVLLGTGVLAYTNAVSRFGTLMGWDLTTWHKVSQNALRLAHTVFATPRGT